MRAADAAEMMAALGQETRLAVMRLLVSAGTKGVPAGDISQRLGAPSSTTSFHLKVLERGGLVRCVRRGRRLLYAARTDALHDLLGFLGETYGDNLGVAPDRRAVAQVRPREDEDERPLVPAFNVLFLCTKNSARSLLAEAILTKVGGTRFTAYSAGNEPAQQPLRAGIDLLTRLGHDTDGLQPKSWDEFLRPHAPRMDFVIGLCDTLVEDFATRFGTRPLAAMWPLPDPVKFGGTEPQMIAFVNQVYASLRRRIDIFVDLPFDTLGRAALRARLDALAEDPLIELAIAGGH